MDNALIDDRRIHVDFSQSVSKLWSQYKRKDHQMGKGMPHFCWVEIFSPSAERKRRKQGNLFSMCSIFVGSHVLQYILCSLVLFLF